MLESLADQPDVAIELVHVDNASSDSSLAIGNGWVGMIQQIANRQNRGFAAALRQGFEAARGEQVLVINPDVRLKSSALTILAHTLCSDATVGAIGPKLLDPAGEVTSVSARRLPNLRGAASRQLGSTVLSQRRASIPSVIPLRTMKTSGTWSVSPARLC